MLPNALAPSVDDLLRLNAQQAVDLIRDILQAEAGLLDISPTLVTVPSNVNAPDGGVDAHVDANDARSKGHGIIFSGHTYYQIKTGAFKGTTEAELKSLLFPPKALKRPAKPTQGKKKGNPKAAAAKLTAADFNHGIRDCLQNKGTLVVVLFGCDNPKPKGPSLPSRLKELIAKTDSSFKGAKVKVWYASHIAKLSVVAPAAALTVRGIRGAGVIHSVTWMGRSSGFEGEFLAGKAEVSAIQTIRSGLLASDPAFQHIRIVGEPGIGKTRLVFEAANVPELAPRVLYAASAEEVLSSQILSELEYVVADTRLILIVDECAPEHRTTIHQRLRTHAMKLVTIYSELDDNDKSPEYSLIEPPALADPQLSALLATYGVPPERIKWLIPLLGGSPRVAHAVGASLAQSDKVEELLSPRTLDNIWDHYIAGKQGANSPAYHARHVVLACLALFKRFGANYPVAEEARAIHAGIISVVDPSIAWARFTTTLRELRARRILQGTATLYISPKLLHIKLWCDWWERYSGAIPPASLLDALPDRLVEWLGDMFVYARESTVASQVVAQLLAPEGYFSRLAAYSQSKGGNLFFALAQANPKAASRILSSVLGAAEDEQLKSFAGQGRRYIVHALEHMALFEDSFVPAARSLLRLAEAENESWSNNSTGVFTGLFTLGYGKVASTQLPPEQRLPVLVEAIRSEKPAVRAIAIKAFGQSLSTRFTRISLGEVHGLREIPNGWMPKTYGELFEAYRLYLESFWKAINSVLPEDEKELAIREILSNARSLVGMEKVQDSLLDILEQIAGRSEAGTLAVIEQISTILHYDRKGMQESLKARLLEIYERLAEGSYHARLRRNVALQLVHDHFEEDGEYRDGPSKTIIGLAMEGVKNAKLLLPELGWLVTNTAENGFAFGLEVGKKDDGSLWPHIFRAWLERGEESDSLFIGGYLAGVFSKSASAWEQMIEDVATSPGKRSLPVLVWRSGMSPRVAELLVEGMRSGHFDAKLVRAFAYGGAAMNLPLSALREMIDFLLARADQARAEVAVELWFHGMRPRADKGGVIWDVAEKVLSHDSFFRAKRRSALDTMCEYYWKEAAKALLSRRPAAAIRLAERGLESFGEEGTVFGGYRPQTLEFLELVVKDNPTRLWRKIATLIGPPMDTRAFHLLSWLRGDSGFREETDRGAFRLFPTQLLFAWVDGEPSTRAPYIARYVPNTFMSSGEAPSLFRVMLERYGKSAEVRSELHSNFHTEGWTGSSTSHYMYKLAGVKAFLEREENPHVRKWLLEEAEELTASIERERAREERE